MFLNKLSQAQQLVLQAVVSMAGSALIGAFTAAYQYYQNGNVNVGETLMFALTTFFVLFGGALYAYVPGHAQIEMQALADSVTALRAYNSTLIQQSVPPTPTVPTTLPQALQTPVQVHVYTNGTPVVAAAGGVPGDVQAGLSGTPTSVSPPVSSDVQVAQQPFANVGVLATAYRTQSLGPVNLVPVEHPPMSEDTTPRAVAHQ